MFSKYKLLIPSLIAMFLILSFGIFVTVTYAWVTANRDVGGDTDTVNVDLPIIILASDTFSPNANQTTIQYELLEDNGFVNTINFSPTNVLYPSTTYDGINYRYATNVNTNGQFLPSTGEIDTFEAVDSLYTRYFYLEKTFYLCNVYTSNVTVYLSSVEFTSGTENSNLYKAIRLSITSGNNTKIISHPDGQAYPAIDGDNVASTDPSIRSNNINNNTYNINLPAMAVNEDTGKYECRPILVTIRVWIEGQSNHAVVAYSGHAFKVDASFDVK